MNLKGRNLIAIASNKDGVGKTFLASSLAHAFSGFKQNVLFFDGDLSSSNIDSQIELNIKDDLNSVVNGYKTLNQVVYHYDKSNFDVISARAGSADLSEIPIGRLQILGDDLSIISNGYDKVVLDTKSGADRSARVLSGLARELIIICTDEPSTLTEAYSLIRIMTEQYPNTNLNVVVNQANSEREGQRTYESLQKACQDFIGSTPRFLGVVRRDTRVRDAVRNKLPFLSRYPSSEAAEDVIKIARKLI